MADVRDAFQVVKGKTIEDFMNYLQYRYEQSRDNGEVLEHFKATRAYAEIGLAIYDYSEYLKEQSDGKSRRT